jgi:hypothetical protein
LRSRDSQDGPPSGRGGVARLAMSEEQELALIDVLREILKDEEL